MTASRDAAGLGNDAPSPRRRGAPNVVLTAAVLILIYEQVPLPYGLSAARPWLHPALPVLGGILAASLSVRSVRDVKALGMRVRQKLARIVQVQLTFKRDGDHDGRP